MSCGEGAKSSSRARADVEGQAARDGGVELVRSGGSQTLVDVARASFYGSATTQLGSHHHEIEREELLPRAKNWLPWACSCAARCLSAAFPPPCMPKPACLTPLKRNHCVGATSPPPPQSKAGLERSTLPHAETRAYFRFFLQEEDAQASNFTDANFLLSKANPDAYRPMLSDFAS
jgi:hypothetical protein